MRPEPQIQMAHDVLHAVLTGKVDAVEIVDEDAREMMLQALTALCWVLGHDQGDEFGRRYAAVAAAVKRAGYDAVRKDVEP